MREVNGFAKLLMVLSLVIITIIVVLFAYLILMDQEIIGKDQVASFQNNQNEIQMPVQNQVEIKDDTNITAYNLFYVQLDETAKIMYTALENHQEDMKSGNYRIEFGYQFNDLLQEEGGTEKLNQSFQSAWNAYRFDHMEVFYLDVSKIFLFTKTTVRNDVYTYEVSLGAEEGKNYLVEGFDSKEKIEEAENEIEMIANELINYGVEKSEAERIKQIHDWMVDNISYEQEESEDSKEYDIYGALIGKKAVCEGYARAFKFLLDKMEIPCILVAGTGTNANGETESHAWNYVFLNGTWYAVDVTWDDPIILGNGMLDQERRYQYFLKGSEAFFQTHTQNGILSDNSMEFQYPLLSQVDFEEE